MWSENAACEKYLKNCDGNVLWRRFTCMVAATGRCIAEEDQEMTHKSFMTAIVAAAFALTATSTLASGDQSGGQGPKPSFQELDSDGDGQITQEEMGAMAGKRFSEADADGNGSLSLEEMQAQGQKRMMERVGGMMKRLDKDGDGSLSQEEMSAEGRGGMMFGKLDADNSGGISQEEFKMARGKMMQGKGMPGGKGHKNGQGGGMMGGQGGQGQQPATGDAGAAGHGQELVPRQHGHRTEHQEKAPRGSENDDDQEDGNGDDRQGLTCRHGHPPSA